MPPWRSAAASGGLALLAGASAGSMVLAEHGEVAAGLLRGDGLPADLKGPALLWIPIAVAGTVALWVCLGWLHSRHSHAGTARSLRLSALGLAPLLALAPMVLAGAFLPELEELSMARQAAVGLSFGLLGALLFRPRVETAGGVWMSIALATLYALGFSALTCLRHERFLTNALDLAHFVNVCWNDLHGDSFWASIDGFHLYGIHFSPILHVTVALYALAPFPETLLVLQSVLLGAAGVPIYLLARRCGGDRLFAAALCGIYLLNPFVHSTNLFDYHEISYAPLLAALCVLALESGHGPAAVLCVVLLFTVKENMAVAVFAIGAWAALERSRRFLGLGMMAAAVAVGWMTVVVLIPLYRGEPYAYASRFGPGGGFAGLGLKILSDPLWLPGFAGSPEKLGTCIRLLLPFAMLPLLSRGAFLLLCSAEFLLASDPFVARLEVHYGCVAASLTACAAACGIRAISPRWARGLVLFGLAYSAQDAFRRLPSSFPLGPATAHERSAKRLIEATPPGVPVSAQNPYASHLAGRRAISPFPMRVGKRWVFLDLKNPSRYPSRSLVEFLGHVGQMLSRGWHRLARHEDGLLLFEPGRPGPESIAAVIEECSPVLGWYIDRQRSADAVFLQPRLVEGLTPGGLGGVLEALRKRGSSRVLAPEGTVRIPDGLFVRDFRACGPRLVDFLRGIPEGELLLLAGSGPLAGPGLPPLELQRLGLRPPTPEEPVQTSYAAVLEGRNGGLEVLLERRNPHRGVLIDVTKGMVLSSGRAAPKPVRIRASGSELQPFASIEVGKQFLGGPERGLLAVRVGGDGKVLETLRFHTYYAQRAADFSLDLIAWTLEDCGQAYLAPDRGCVSMKDGWGQVARISRPWDPNRFRDTEADTLLLQQGQAVPQELRAESPGSGRWCAMIRYRDGTTITRAGERGRLVLSLAVGDRTLAVPIHLETGPGVAPLMLVDGQDWAEPRATQVVQLGPGGTVIDAFALQPEGAGWTELRRARRILGPVAAMQFPPPREAPESLEIQLQGEGAVEVVLNGLALGQGIPSPDGSTTVLPAAGVRWAPVNRLELRRLGDSRRSIAVGAIRFRK